MVMSEEARSETDGRRDNEAKVPSIEAGNGEDRMQVDEETAAVPEAKMDLGKMLDSTPSTAESATGTSAVEPSHEAQPNGNILEKAPVLNGESGSASKVDVKPDAPDGKSDDKLEGEPEPSDVARRQDDDRPERESDAKQQNGQPESKAAESQEAGSEQDGQRDGLPDDTNTSPETSNGSASTEKQLGSADTSVDVDESHYAPGNALAVLADLSSVAPHSPTLQQSSKMSQFVSAEPAAEPAVEPAVEPSVKPSDESADDVSAVQAEQALQSHDISAASRLITPPGSSEKGETTPSQDQQLQQQEQQSALPSSGKRELDVTPIEGPPKKEYPVDAGVIRCICGFDDDDGFTIQCEKCNAWQHAQCVEIADEAHVPDIYYCDQCSDRKVNVQLAVERQTRRMQSGKRRKPRSRKEDGKEGSRSGQSTRSSSPSKAGKDGKDGRDASSASKDKDEQADADRKDKEKDKDGGNSSTSGKDAKDGKGGKRGRRKQATRTARGAQTEAPTADDESDSDAEFSGARAKAYESHFVRIDANHVQSPAVAQFMETVPTLGLDEEVYSELTPAEYRAVKPVKLFVRSTADATRMQQFRGFSKYGVYVESAIPRDRLIAEFVGEVMFQKDYKANPINQYRFYACPKPGVIFVPSLPLAVDGRRVGSETSFIRYSCRPNVRFSTVVIDDDARPAASRVHFAAFALEAIRPGTELTVAWEFDPAHPVRKLMAGEDVSALSAEERDFLGKSYAMLLERGMECACDAAGDCVLNLMKKAETGIRSTRAGTKKHFEKREEATTTPPAPSVRPTRGAAASSVVAGTPEPTVYSALVERRLENALSIIDGIAASGKRKRDESAGAESSGAASAVGSPQSADAGPQLAAKAVQTETIHKRLRDGSPVGGSSPTSPSATPRSPHSARSVGSTTAQSVLPPHKRRLVRYLESKKGHEAADQRSPTSSPSSPNMTLLSRATFGNDPLAMTPRMSFSALYSEETKDPATMGPTPSGASASSGAAIKSTAPAATAPSGKSGTASPVLPAAFAAPSTGLANAQQPANTAATPAQAPRPPVKKLSFADYKKKQKPMSAISRSASPSPAASPTTTAPPAAPTAAVDASSNAS